MPPPPLILGATGRIGRAFRALWDRGHWPAAREPLWHHRPGHAVAGNAIAWTLGQTPPADYRLHLTRGIVVLAGATGGDDAALRANTDAALAALRLRDSGVAGPVLLMSSAAVYGRAPGLVDEDFAPAPLAPYGAAKVVMEAAVAGQGATCLRLANVAGSDMLFAGMARGDMTLDVFDDGTSPRRSYIGPLTLARTLLHLIGLPALPPVLNLASPGTVAMDDILAAAGVDWRPVPAPPAALRSLAMDTARLAALCPLPPAEAASLVAEAQVAGWRAAR